jgi:hypothetical protein
MDNVQKHNSCANGPSSQTFRSYQTRMSTDLNKEEQTHTWGEHYKRVSFMYDYSLLLMQVDNTEMGRAIK